MDDGQEAFLMESNSEDYAQGCPKDAKREDDGSWTIANVRGRWRLESREGATR
jgi:hypothetical protein